MRKPAIVVENLSKSYRLGLRAKQHQSFREALTGMATAPFRRLRELGEQGTAEDTFWALKDVNFEVEPGEVVGIIGRNGAGKSTLLKVLSRIVEPTSGRIRLRGRVASLLEVGTGFHPELTGRENIYMNGSILGMRKAEIDRKFDEIVAFAEVEKFLDTPVKRYSSGMYVRLAFAVAAHLEPEILIVDEVLAVGDAEFQKKCLGKMQEVSQDHGRTVLFVSHNMDAVAALCTSGILMENGINTGILPPDEVIRRYLGAGLNAEGGIVDLANATRIGSPTRSPSLRTLTISIGDAPTRIVPTGSPVTFLIDLGSFDDLKSPECGIVLTNDRRQRIAAFHTKYHSNLAFSSGSCRRLICHVPSLPLTPGTYDVDLVLNDSTTLAERIERAAQIEIVFADTLGTGKVPSYSQGHVILPAQWRQVV